MTERYNALIVVLDRDIRTDDCQPIIDAIGMLKGVASVEGNVADHDSYIAAVRARAELLDQVRDTLFNFGKVARS